MALVGKGEKDKGIRVCDIAFLHSPSDQLSLLLLIKVRDPAQPWSSVDFIPYQAVVLFMAGEHVDAISRMDDLITHMWAYPASYVVQERETCPYIQ